MNPNCDPMIYPLLFPYAEQGWRADIRYTGSGRVQANVSPMKFYSYKLQVRDDHFPTLHRARKLFHQYIVYAYTKVEGHRLDFIRNQQAALRIDRYQGLMDFVETGSGFGSHLEKVYFTINFHRLSQGYATKFQRCNGRCACAWKTRPFYNSYM